MFVVPVFRIEHDKLIRLRLSTDAILPFTYIGKQSTSYFSDVLEIEVHRDHLEMPHHDHNSVQTLTQNLHTAISCN